MITTIRRTRRQAIVVVAAGLGVLVLGVSLALARAPESESIGSPPGAAQTLTVIETFDTDPSSRWASVTAGEATLGWHWRVAGNNCYNPAGMVGSYPYSGTGRLWMGQFAATPPDPPPFNVPYCNYGGVGSPGRPPMTQTVTISSPFTVSTGGTHTYLVFWSYEHTEKTDQDSTDTCLDTPVCDKDIRRVYIKEVSAGSWTKIWDTKFDAAIEKLWHSAALNIDAWRGQSVLIRFEFTTAEDAYLDHFPGWYIDQVYTFDTSSEVYLPVVFKAHQP